MTSIPASDPVDYANPAPPAQAPGLVFPMAVLALYWAFWLVWQNLEVATFPRFAGRMFSSLLATVVLAVWWLTRRRVSWRGRLLVAAAFVGAAVVTASLSKNTFG